ncbi:hypothetical protein EVAR_40457_1 [Eumeta japonica]|uniref:Uncharacterized protein n=1 Tax=Eumeta variegata TaxID=151549 RepID=A0A4C1WY34_EUMVA|nr:hypothetical protein EVAR_40457_1 [Eumeta japonica]
MQRPHLSATSFVEPISAEKGRLKCRSRILRRSVTGCHLSGLTTWAEFPSQVVTGNPGSHIQRLSLDFQEARSPYTTAEHDTQNEICLRNSYFEKTKRVSAEKSQKAKMDEIQSMSGSLSNMSQKQIAAKVQVKYPSLLLTKNDVLREVNNAQIALQSKGLCVDEIIIKLEALRLFIGEKRLHLAEEAIDFAVQKSEQYNISMERRIRRKKRVPGELASSTDAGLTLRAELQKDILECLDRLNIELEKKSKVH